MCDPIVTIHKKKIIIKNNNKKITRLNTSLAEIFFGGGEGVFLQFFMTSLGSLNFDPITKII